MGIENNAYITKAGCIGDILIQLCFRLQSRFEIDYCIDKTKKSTHFDSSNIQKICAYETNDNTCQKPAPNELRSIKRVRSKVTISFTELLLIQ